MILNANNYDGEYINSAYEDILFCHNQQLGYVIQPSSL